MPRLQVFKYEQRSVVVWISHNIGSL